MKPAAIELKNICKTYLMGESHIKALNTVSICLHRQELVALEGPSGSGKSTLLNICGLLDEADSGSLSILGKSVVDLNQRQRTLFRRDCIGFIFQSFNLIPVMTAYENVEYPLILKNESKRKRKYKVFEILEKVGLKPLAHHVPDHLSGGQRQRLAVARALVKKPTLVIADEPTASLDTQTAADIIEMMKSLCAELGTHFLIATHDERMATHCERVIKLVDGRIL